MISTPRCPVCDCLDWSRLGSRHYERRAIPATPFECARHEVMFDVWMPAVEGVDLETLACARCGMVIYSPRPDENDLRRKYEYLNSHPTAMSEHGRDLPSDHQRSSELFSFVAPCLGEGEPLSVMDFGGGKGRLLHEFLAHGYRCGVVDYVDEVIPGVNYLGRELANLPQDTRFDLVLCSHVIEHLADPLDVVTDLTTRLTDHGHLYIEVPSEIWKRPPPVMDPVTHINFFTPDSLRTLMERAGLKVLICRYETFTRPNGKVGLAIKAIGRPSGDGVAGRVSFAGTAALPSLLSPSILDRILRVMRHPRLLRNLLA